MRCLLFLILLPLLLLVLLFAPLFSVGRRRNFNDYRRTRDYTDDKATKDDDRYVNAQTVDYEEISTDETSTATEDYDPNPSNTRRVEDAKWEEIE